MMSELDGLSGFSTINSLIPQQPKSNPNPPPLKKKRNLPGTPDPEAEVISMSPKSLMEKNRFVCEICKKGFQREQNLQLHRRGHNLPWKLRQRGSSKEMVRKKVYVCPEKSCVHHEPARALGDLTGIKKHYSRKHGEKKWKCEKCSKKYAVHSDWKAHSKICGTKQYKCDCGTLFTRKDSFITHRAFCDAISEENSKFTSVSNTYPTTYKTTPDSFINETLQNPQESARIITQFSSVDFQPHFADHNSIPLWLDPATNPNPFISNNLSYQTLMQQNDHPFNLSEPVTSPAHMSATALLQKAAEMGSTTTAGFEMSSGSLFNSYCLDQNVGREIFRRPGNEPESVNELMDNHRRRTALMGGVKDEGQRLTRDFLGVGNHNGRSGLFLEHDDLVHMATMGSSFVELNHYSQNH